MNILLTGGTGLIGQALIRLWQTEHQLIILSRSERHDNRNNVRFVTSLTELDFNQIDAIVNLAGEPIANKRWTEKQKERICQSRWQLTEQLSNLVQGATTPPKVFISGSAIGFYGRQDSQEITEDYHAFYPEFSHDICARWENLAMQAKNAQTRVCLLRTGIVLADNGGALKKMLPPFKLGLGGIIGSGQQFMSWIHIDDMAALIDFTLKNPEVDGPINAVAPKAVNNKTFTQELAKRLSRPAIFPMPAMMAKLLFGEMADILLYGQNVVPKKLIDAGFHFRYPQLNGALAALSL